MDAVTYPHETVIETLAERFVPYRINIMERNPDFKEASAGGRVMWGSTFRVADPRYREVRRWVGWLPPEAFVAELAFCRGMVEFNQGRFAEARAIFDVVVEIGADTAIHPEALYWQGIAGFLAGGKDWAALRAAWERLARDYPGNRFGTHAAVIEDAPPA